MDKMLAAVRQTPQMLIDAFGLGLNGTLKKSKKIKQLVVLGMGGSAIAGDIVAALLREKSKLPVFVERGYHLPAFIDGSSLIFVLSYSGDTEETLSVLKETRSIGAKIICITSGGKLKNIAEKNKLPYFLIPTGLQPRAALPYLLVPILKILAFLGLYPGLKKELDETLQVLRRLADDAEPKQLAKAMVGKIPLILAANGITAAAAKRWRGQFSENSKVTSSLAVFPELCHNEIVSLAALRRGEHSFCLLLLRDEDSHPRLKKRIDITKSLIGNQVGGIHEVWTSGRSSLAKVFFLIHFGDLLSVHLALLLERDPSEVNVISRLKKELSR